MKWIDKLKNLLGIGTIDVSFDDKTLVSVYDASRAPISTRSLEAMLKHSRPGYTCDVHWRRDD